MPQSNVLEVAKRCKMLCLNTVGLYTIPAAVFSVTDLIRLDIGYNQIRELPSDLFGSLVSLQQLWLNHNPIEEIPVAIEKLKKLQLLDIADCKIRTLPPQLGRLKNLVHVCLSGNPLEDELMPLKADTPKLMAYLVAQDSADILKEELSLKLGSNLYREFLLGKGRGKELLPKLVDAVRDLFPDVTELAEVVRHCDRLFLPTLTSNVDGAAAHVREKYNEMKIEHELKRLSTEVELKIKAIYADRIDPHAVEGCIKSIYSEVNTIEDVKFLVRHAAAILPKEAKNIAGSDVKKQIGVLRRELAQQAKLRKATETQGNKSST